MKPGKIKFKDILGDRGIYYDNWLDKQIEGYYLTYKQNFYSDKFDFSIERENCISEPVFLAKTIEEITNKIDNEIQKSIKVLNVKFVGIDDWNRPVYKDKKGYLYKDVHCGMGTLSLCTVYLNKFYGEPDIPIKEDIKVNVVQNFQKERER